jgi:preprotein translocase subunit SecD
MSRSVCLLAAVALFLGCQAGKEGPQDRATPVTQGKVADGVYAVRRDSVREQDLLPLQDGEALVVNRHRYLNQDQGEPPIHVVVRAIPDVGLDLARAPEAVTEKGEVVRILLKLRPDAAAALERLTGDPQCRQVAIVLGSEIVTMHKVREPIRGGDVQITSCAPGAASYLLDRLRTAHAAPSP